MMIWFRALGVGCLLLSLVSCGDDGGGDGGGGGFRGTATLTIGGETWEFDNFDCAFGHDATESTLYSFTTNSFGVHSDGHRVQMQADIADSTGQGRYEGTDVVFNISIDDIEDFQNPSVSFESTMSGLTTAMTTMAIDGDNITASGPFDDQNTGPIEEVNGALTGVCSSDSRR